MWQIGDTATPQFTPAPVPEFVTVRFVACAICGEAVEGPRAYVPGTPRSRRAGHLFGPVNLLASCGNPCGGRRLIIRFRPVAMWWLGRSIPPLWWPSGHAWPPRYDGPLPARPSAVLTLPTNLHHRAEPRFRGDSVIGWVVAVLIVVFVVGGATLLSNR